MDTSLLTLLTPVLVYLVTALVNWLKPNLSGWLIVGVIVPVLSLAGAWIAGLLGSTTGFGWQLLLNFLAISINEVLKQLKQGVVSRTNPQ